MLIVLIFLISLILSIFLWIMHYIAIDNTNEIIENVLSVLALICTIIALIFLVGSTGLIGIEGQNREEFLKAQQEYVVLKQYIKSNKSDSILESQDMMNRIKNYNDLIITRQNNMTRPFKKYYEKGVNWNELKLIDLLSSEK